MQKPLLDKARSLFILSDNKIMLALAVVIGIADGAAAAGLIKLINLVIRLTGLGIGAEAPGMQAVLRLCIPALGGLAAGFVIQHFDTAAEKTGVGQVIASLKLNKGLIPLRTTLTKFIATAFTVGSGASVGPEAPVIHIGGGIGSFFAHLRHLSDEKRQILVVAGAAGGLAAIFNTPIAAVVFALEVLLKVFDSGTFALVVLTTVTASVSTHIFLGNRPYFPILNYAFNSPWELGYYFLLGIVCAPVAKLFQGCYHFFEDVFDRWTSASRPIKAMVGGLLMGLIAIRLPQVMWDGHLIVSHLLSTDDLYKWSIGFLLLLVLAKILATSLTVSSGGSGGMMIPAMFIGALTGMAYGRWVQGVFPAAANPGAYGLVAMAAVLAGVTHAPFTAIMMLYELTGDNNIILPLMFTVGITMLLARWLHAGGMESRELARKGITIPD